MKEVISFQAAVKGALVILSLLVIFQLLVISSIIPYQVVWGGRLKNHSQMISYGIISIILNLLMLLVVGVYAKIIKVRINQTLLKVLLWLMFAMFALNTIGNLLSKNLTEALIFTPLTLLLALFSFRLAVEK